MKMTTNVQEAIDVLKSGGVVVYPTETSYGLGCDVTNAEAIARIFAMKGRPAVKAIAAILPSNDWGEKYGLQWPPVLRALADKYWPGALNIVLPIRGSVVPSKYVLDGTFAVRHSSHTIASALADGAGVPIVSTSANISGEPDQYSAQAIYDRYMQQTLRPDLVFDAGEIPKTAPSTLVKLSDDGTVVVLRQGEIVV
jgi:L-threonylcarbamoyladenylate synthase